MSRCLLCCFDRAGAPLVESGEVAVINDSGNVEGKEQYLQETLGMPASERRLVQDTAELIFSQMHLEKKSVTFLIAFFKRYPHHQRYFKAFRNIPPEDLKTLPQMENHGRRVMDQMSRLIDHIEDPKMLQEQLTWISTRHKPRKVSARQFKDMLAMFVEFTGQEMGSLFTPQHEIAWQHWLNYILNVLEGEDSKAATEQNGESIQSATPSSSPIPITPVSADAVDITLEEPSTCDAGLTKLVDPIPAVDSGVESSTNIDCEHENSNVAETNTASADTEPCDESNKTVGAEVDPVSDPTTSSEKLRDETVDVENVKEVNGTEKNSDVQQSVNNSVPTDNGAKHDTNKAAEATENKDKTEELDKPVNQTESLESNHTKTLNVNGESYDVDNLINNKPSKDGVNWVDSGINTIIKDLCDNVVTPFNGVQNEKISCEKMEELVKVDNSAGDTTDSTKASLDAIG